MKKGFTLLELTIVIVIIGIIAAIAIPRFIEVRDRAEGRQPLIMLSSIRSSLSRHIVDPESGGCTTDLSDLDIGVPTDPNWSYAITSCVDENNFLITATKTGGANNGTTVTMDQDGNRGGTHPGAS